MLIGSLAISGIPFFSGFFSKDEILYSTIALPNGHSHLFLIGVITAILTALYTGRMMSMTFYGKERLDHHAQDHLHESPGLMLFPLYVLAALAALGGFFGVPHLLGDYLGHMPHYLAHWLDPVIPSVQLPLVGVKLALHEGLVMAASSVFALVAFLLGIKLFKNIFWISDLVNAITPFHKVLQNKYYIDELYQKTIISPIGYLAKACANIFDRLVIDGSINGLGNSIRSVGVKLKVIQDGDVQSYALYMVVAIGLISALIVFLAY
jgi:NADH-quinone oxidoreductase subunit L